MGRKRADVNLGRANKEYSSRTSAADRRIAQTRERVDAIERGVIGLPSAKRERKLAKRLAQGRKITETPEEVLLRRKRRRGNAYDMIKQPKVSATAAAVQFDTTRFPRAVLVGAQPEDLGDEVLEVSAELKRARRALGVNVRGPKALVARCPAPMDGFEDDRFPKSARALVRQLQASKHFAEPTPVQAQAWPAIMSGADVLCVAETGSGKTLGYVLPIAPHIIAQRPVLVGAGTNSAGPVALILVPTRELAQQVRGVCKSLLARSHDLHCVALVGGVAKVQQLEELRKRAIHIVVATPGRLVDLTAAQQVVLRRTTYVVLDEADRMMAMGFQDQLDAIFAQIRPDCQKLMFSATFAKPMQELASKWAQNNALVIKVR